MKKSLIFLVVGVLFLSGCTTEEESPFSRILNTEQPEIERYTEDVPELHAFPEYHARMDPGLYIIQHAEGEMEPIEQLFILQALSLYYKALELEDPEICYYAGFIEDLEEDGFTCDDFLYNSEEVLISWGAEDYDNDGDVDYFDLYEHDFGIYGAPSKIMNLFPEN